MRALAVEHAVFCADVHHRKYDNDSAQRLQLQWQGAKVRPSVVQDVDAWDRNGGPARPLLQRLDV